MKYFAIINISKVLNFSKNIIGYLFSRVSKNYFIFGKPSFASFELSSFCNLHCPQCDVGNNLTSRNSKYLDFDSYCKILDQIGPTLINAIFYFQGEPFLNKSFARYISYAKQYNIHTITSTNAQLINKNIAHDIVLSGLDKLIVSIDGTTEETYQKYRKGGTLKKTIESLKILHSAKLELKSSTPHIEAQFIVFSFNENQISDFRRLAPIWGADSVAIKSAQICDPDKDFSLIPSISKYSRYEFSENKWSLKRDYHHPCFRAWSGLVVSSDLNVLPCCFDKREEHIYDNFLSSGDIISIWKNYNASSFRSSLLSRRFNIPMCRNCNE